MTELLEHIANHTEDLACDKHAQYVLQALCDRGRARWPVKVINKLLLLDTSRGAGGVAVRFGGGLVHAAGPDEAAAVLHALQRLREQDMATNPRAPAPPSLPALSGAAADLLGLAVEAVQMLEAPTMARLY